MRGFAIKGLTKAKLNQRGFLGPSAPLLPIVLSLWFALLIALPIAIVSGSADIPLREIVDILLSFLTGADKSNFEPSHVTIVLELRLPRALLALIVGASLAIVGTIMQALVRNSLADPYVLGISSGASIGAASIIVFNLFSATTLIGTSALSVASFIGASIAMTLVYLVARAGQGLSPVRLILSGFAFSYLFSAITSLIVFLGDQRAASSVVFWLLGGLGRAQWSLLLIPFASLLILVSYAIYRGRWLNSMAMGDDIAISVGINVKRFRVILFLLSSLVTGVVVSVSGAIGFVGLVVPHIARLILGSDHRRVLMFSIPLGSFFVLAADTIARTVVAPQVLPLGVVTALVGGPIFIMLLLKRSGRISSV